MPNLTKNLKLNTWLENEIVDFEQINENFQKIDALVSCIDGGTVNSEYKGFVEGNTGWQYKKYTDGTVEMSTKLEFTTMKCDGGDVIPYYSGAIDLYFPFKLTTVYGVQMQLSSNTVGWITDITPRAVNDHVTFRVQSMKKEENAIYKKVFVNVKGVLLNG